MKLFVALDNIRSTYNVGAIARTAYGFDIAGIITIGVTPHMQQKHDPRLPHIIDRAEREIRKTALQGEVILGQHYADPAEFLEVFAGSHDIVAIEKTENSTPIDVFSAQNDTVLVLGSEVDGVSPVLLSNASAVLSIPIADHKESYNVSAAGAIALYELHTQFATL